MSRFRDDEVVSCVAAHVSTLANGQPYTCHVGDRFLATDERVRRNEPFFKSDGSDYQWFPPDPEDEPQPESKPRPPKKLLRSRRDWTGVVEGPVPSWGGERERYNVTTHTGTVFDPDEKPWVSLLSPAKRRSLFEEVAEQ